MAPPCSTRSSPKGWVRDKPPIQSVRRRLTVGAMSSSLLKTALIAIVAVMVAKMLFSKVPGLSSFAQYL